MIQTLTLSSREILTLKDDRVLSREELWLKEAYANIVFNLAGSTLAVVPKFDPISSKFMGIHSEKYNQFEYQGLLEATSYIWASKGGRGALLEKAIASFGGTHAANSVPLKKIPSMIIAQKKALDSVPVTTDWKIQDSYKKLKFDLVNIIGDSIIILELKNRVDSGGTAAREEALSKKFFALCQVIEQDQKIFEHRGMKYSLSDALNSLGIKNLELYVGLLYGVYGKEAIADDDRKDGFYSRSKTMIQEFGIKPHRTKITYDELGLSFSHGGINVVVKMLYGNDVIHRFLRKSIDIDVVMEKVFAKIWMTIGWP